METLQRENDALLVDDLLDFSCGDIGEGDVVTCIREKENDSSCLQKSAAICSLEGNIVRPSQGSSEADCLYSPADELYTAEWEWLSSFVEESYKGADHSLPLVSSDEWFSTGGRKEGCFIRRAGDGKRATSWLRMGASSQILDVGSSPLIEMSNTSSCWPPASASRSRSKRSSRSRSGGRVWSLQTVTRPRPRPRPPHKTSTLGLAEEEDDDQETSSLDYEPYPLIYCKKANKGHAMQEEDELEEGRRCSHCQVQKTPQWRTGPLGPKTLCNACGVRYKSGRLLPEYRPAASPTFISQLHSNSHKKVLEMRTLKSCVTQELDQEELSSCSQESMHY